jgi:hypothetical protein
MPSGMLYRVALVRTVKVEAIWPPKRRFLLEPHSTKSHKASRIDTAMKASQKTSDHQPYIVSVYREADQQWFQGNTTMESYQPEDPEDRGHMLSETSALTRAIWHEVPEDIFHWHSREGIPEDSVFDHKKEIGASWSSSSSSSLWFPSASPQSCDTKLETKYSRGAHCEHSGCTLWTQWPWSLDGSPKYLKVCCLWNYLLALFFLSYRMGSVCYSQYCATGEPVLKRSDRLRVILSCKATVSK